MLLKKEDIENIARLARLEVTPVEAEKFGEQLTSILAYAQKLLEVSGDGVQAIEQIHHLQNTVRVDEVNGETSQADALLSQAPETKDRYIKTQAVLKSKK